MPSCSPNANDGMSGVKITSINIRTAECLCGIDDRRKVLGQEHKYRPEEHGWEIPGCDTNKTEDQHHA